ncbi:MAG: serine/threonine-protein kinase [Planctomycetota bacterium]
MSASAGSPERDHPEGAPLEGPAPDGAVVDGLVTAILSQEGAAPDPARSIGRHSLRLARAGSGPLDLAELPLLRVDDAPGADLSVRGLIGRGGMGQVELALQRCLRRDVALKRLHAEAGPADAEALVQEALHTGSLEHPNVVPVHQLGRDAQDRPLLLMQRVSGVTWLELLEDPDHARWAELPQDRLSFHLDVLRQVCNALHYAHNKGLLHRDLKPENVMLGRYGEVYLLDWGLAVPLDQPRAPDGPIVGTPAYFAPEMADLSQPLSVRTDVYLLGATLHHVLTGAPRHTRGPDGLRSVVYSAYRSEPFAYDASVPGELAELMNEATHRDLARRPESAMAFRQRLEAFLQHRGSVRTCAAALEGLVALRALLEAPGPAAQEEVVARFTACRLGCEQALEDWPGNEAARQGLQRCLELRIEHELAQRNKGTAQELLASLPEARPELEARLAALTAELEEEARSREALRRLQEDLDVTGAGRVRAALFLLVGVLAGGGMLLTAALSRLGWLEPTRALRAGYRLALPLVFAGGVFVARDALLRTTGARKIAACAGLLVLSPLLATWTARATQATDPTALASILQTVVLAVMAVAFDARIGWIAAVTGAIALGCVAWPARYLEIQGVGTFLAFAVAARVTQPRGAD